MINSFTIYQSKILKWGKLLTVTGLVQGVSQISALLCGLIILRLLPTKEYALYTLANTMLGTMAILADSGVSTAVMNQAGKVWTDQSKLGEVISTGLELRKKFIVASLIFSVPILLYLLSNHGASWLTSVLIIAALVPIFIATLSNTLLEVAPKLQQDIIQLQKNQLKFSLSRLAVTACALLLFPCAFVSILAAGIPQVWANSNLRKLSSKYADYSQKSNLLIQDELIKSVKKIAPYSIYFCISGQLSLWLISFFGSTDSIAQAGALGRIAIAINFFSILFGILLVPRFTRLQVGSKKALQYYVRIQLIMLLTCVFFITAAYFFPSSILLLPGDKYSNLEHELLLSIINGCIGMIAGVSFALCTTRGWIINPKFAIPVNVVAIICSASVVDVSSLKGVLMFNILVETVIAVMNVSYGLVRATSFDNNLTATHE